MFLCISDKARAHTIHLSLVSIGVVVRVSSAQHNILTNIFPSHVCPTSNSLFTQHAYTHYPPQFTDTMCSSTPIQVIIIKTAYKGMNIAFSFWSFHLLCVFAFFFLTLKIYFLLLYKYGCNSTLWFTELCVLLTIHLNSNH